MRLIKQSTVQTRVRHIFPSLLGYCFHRSAANRFKYAPLLRDQACPLHYVMCLIFRPCYFLPAIIIFFNLVEMTKNKRGTVILILIYQCICCSDRYVLNLIISRSIQLKNKIAFKLNDKQP